MSPCPWGFIGIVIFCFIPEVTGLGLHLRAIQFAGPFDHLNCSSPCSNMTKLLYIPVLVSETIIALLTLFKGVQHLRRSFHPFITELYVSGMFFYACILFMTLANNLLPMWVPGSALFLGPFQSILHSTLSNRILLLILKQRRIRRRYPTEERVTSNCLSLTVLDLETT
ncbi:hypothetical protein ARMGADRAFT_742052 [Armillaria gallica]|uniref:Uncharacterized protein n=1 Tax=Armillaria gallica TaxID=47427 RepID=A0A2H3CL88_ARMGA|nr:hypothetical protein ARMGADRAFT_742052 [Armillaria gallica]